MFNTVLPPVRSTVAHTVTEGSGLSNVLDVATNPTADNIESDLDNEALQWAGLSAAMEILNA